MMLKPSDQFQIFADEIMCVREIKNGTILDLYSEILCIFLKCLV